MSRIGTETQHSSLVSLGQVEPSQTLGSDQNPVRDGFDEGSVDSLQEFNVHPAQDSSSVSVPEERALINSKIIVGGTAVAATGIGVGLGFAAATAGDAAVSTAVATMSTNALISMGGGSATGTLVAKQAAVAAAKAALYANAATPLAMASAGAGLGVAILGHAAYNAYQLKKEGLDNISIAKRVGLENIAPGVVAVGAAVGIAAALALAATPIGWAALACAAIGGAIYWGLNRYAKSKAKEKWPTRAESPPPNDSIEPKAEPLQAPAGTSTSVAAVPAVPESKDAVATSTPSQAEDARVVTSAGGETGEVLDRKLSLALNHVRANPTDRNLVLSENPRVTERGLRPSAVAEGSDEQKNEQAFLEILKVPAHLENLRNRVRTLRTAPAPANPNPGDDGLDTVSTISDSSSLVTATSGELGEEARRAELRSGADASALTDEQEKQEANERAFIQAVQEESFPLFLSEMGERLEIGSDALEAFKNLSQQHQSEKLDKELKAFAKKWGDANASVIQNAYRTWKIEKLLREHKIGVLKNYMLARSEISKILAAKSSLEDEFSETQKLGEQLLDRVTELAFYPGHEISSVEKGLQGQKLKRKKEEFRKEIQELLRKNPEQLIRNTYIELGLGNVPTYPKTVNPQKKYKDIIEGCERKLQRLSGIGRQFVSWEELERETQRIGNEETRKRNVELMLRATRARRAALFKEELEAFSALGKSFQLSMAAAQTAEQASAYLKMYGQMGESLLLQNSEAFGREDAAGEQAGSVFDLYNKFLTDAQDFLRKSLTKDEQDGVQQIFNQARANARKIVNRQERSAVEPLQASSRQALEAEHQRLLTSINTAQQFFAQEIEQRAAIARERETSLFDARIEEARKWIDIKNSEISAVPDRKAKL